MIRATFLAITIAAALAGSAKAQFATEGDAKRPGGGVAAQGARSNATTSFDGIDVQVKRLIMDPAGEGAVRLVMVLTSTGAEEVNLLFVGPASSLIDELGNIYSANSSVGIEICRFNSGWTPDFEWCGKSQGNIATRLGPGVPVTVALRFLPTEGFSAELAKMSATVSLRSRLAHYSVDLSKGKTVDIIVNDIPFPR